MLKLSVCLWLMYSRLLLSVISKAMVATSLKTTFMDEQVRSFSYMLDSVVRVIFTKKVNEFVG